MRNKQHSTHKMFVSVLGVLDRFKPTWQPVTAFSAARNDFAAAIDAISTEEIKQSTTTTGITENKRLARIAMSEAAALVGGAVGAWADKQNNHELFAIVNFTASELAHGPEQKSLTNCKNILDAATANLAAIAPDKSLAQADIDDLAAKLATFKGLLTKPREAKALSKGATDHIPDKFAAADRILTRQLDLLMHRFKTSNADFYGAYQVARVVVDTGGGHSGPATPTPPAPPAPAPNS